jgi:hypothetical protein
MEPSVKRFGVLLFGGAFLFWVCGALYFAGPPKPDKIDPISQHGFSVGYTLAQSGMVRPTASELDAYATQAARQLRESGDGFKMQWKSAFWAGWAKGD